MAVQGARVTVGTTPTLLSGTPTDNSAGSRLTVRNPSGTTAVALGGSTVTAAAGYELPAGAVVQFTLGDGESLFGVVTVGTVDVHVVRTGV